MWFFTSQTGVNEDKTDVSLPLSLLSTMSPGTTGTVGLSTTTGRGIDLLFMQNLLLQLNWNLA